MAADGAALLAAAVGAACRAKAPRRTVQAVAAAVAGVLVRPAAAAAVPRPGAAVPAGAQSAGPDDSDPVQLLDSLRAARRAQRIRKKERRRAAKQAADAHRAPSPRQSQSASQPLATPQPVAAGPCAEPGGALAAAPAAPEAPMAVDAPVRPTGALNQQPPSDGEGHFDQLRGLFSDDGIVSLGRASGADLRSLGAGSADSSEDTILGRPRPAVRASTGRPSTAPYAKAPAKGAGKPRGRRGAA
mmetsp:Transcript_50274/g.139588  ORF Transcript_50274/g.139588 Transcript_50274/m.139588 type:complete len:244 (-) Transcript_50274:276-1007(-)